MKKTKKFVLIFAVLSIFSFTFGSAVAEAATYVQDWNIVKGKDLHWRNNSKYTTQLNQAVSTWNGYSSGTIKVFTSANTDVVVSDYTENSNIAGVTSSARTIKLNKKVMDTLTASKKQNVTTHEFGHALGLKHSPEGNVMYKYLSSKTSLSATDKASFNAAKKNWK